MADDNGGASAGSVALAFLSGLLLGAAAAVLLAPQSGSESRERLLRAVRRTGDELRDFTERAGGAWEDVLSKGREFMSEASSIVRDAVEAGREAMRHEPGSESRDPYSHP